MSSFSISTSNVPSINPYVAARSCPTVLVDNAPYINTFHVPRDCPSDELKQALVDLVTAFNNTSPGTGDNNLDRRGWLYPPSDKPPNPDGYTVTTIKGGITNDLYLLRHNPVTLGANGEGVLIRLFGGEGVIDRDKETSTYAALCAAGIGHAYLGRFGNGRVEGFLQGFETLTPTDIADGAISQAIALKLADMHQFKPSQQTEGAYLGSVYPAGEPPEQ